MGQFKPMVKMETTEPSVILKLAKGGHVNMKKSGKAESGHKKMAGGGMSAMGALAGTPALIGRPAVNAPVQAPGKPSMAMRRKAMMAKPAMPMGNPSMPMKKGGKAEGGKMDTAQDKAMIKKAFKQHDSQEHKGGKGTNLKLKKGGKMATGGVTNGQGGYAKGGKTTRKVKGYAEGGDVLAKMMGTPTPSSIGPRDTGYMDEPINRRGIVPLPRSMEEDVDRPMPVTLPQYDEPPMQSGNGNAAMMAQLLKVMGGFNRGNASEGIPSVKSSMGTSAKGASNRTDTEQLVRALMSGKGSQLDSDRVKSSYGDMAGFAKGGIIKTSGVKNGNGGGFATGGVTKSNGGGYNMGGKASKKAYATGGTVNSGKPVAMPQGAKKPSQPISTNRFTGTFKKGGTVTLAEGNLMKAFGSENKTAMKQAKAQSNDVYSKYQKMQSGGIASGEGAVTDRERKMMDEVFFDKNKVDPKAVSDKASRELEEAMNPLSMVKELVGKARNAFSNQGSISDKERAVPAGSVTKTEKSVTMTPSRKRGGSVNC